MSVCKHGIAFSECKDCYQPETEPLPVRPESAGSVLMWCDDCGIRLKFNIDGCPCCGSQNIQTLSLPQ